MKTVIFVGAGQMGQAALRIINQSNYQVVAFADNSRALQGKRLLGRPILSVREAVERKPDGIFIAVAGQERTEELKRQLSDMGYAGEVKTLMEYAQVLDIRGAVFQLLADRVEKLPGDLAELGVYQGDFAAKLNERFPQRKLYLFDTFTGFDPRDIKDDHSYSKAMAGNFAGTSSELVLSKMAAPENVVVRKGYFPDTAAGLDTRFALVSLDADLYGPTLNGLRWFYPRLVQGGIILLHDYRNSRFAGVHAAVDAFEGACGPLLLLPVGDLHGSVVIIHP